MSLAQQLITSSGPSGIGPQLELADLPKHFDLLVQPGELTQCLGDQEPSMAIQIALACMTDQKMAQMAASPWAGFWQELKPAFDYFEETRRVPRVGVAGKSYSVSLVNASFQGARTGHGE